MAQYQDYSVGGGYVNVSTDSPIIGMLCWELGFPRGLQQLEKMPGNVMNPATFDFPVRYERVQGANFSQLCKNRTLARCTP
jgi:hypothetical protein